MSKVFGTKKIIIIAVLLVLGVFALVFGWLDFDFSKLGFDLGLDGVEQVSGAYPDDNVTGWAWSHSGGAGDPGGIGWFSFNCQGTWDPLTSLCRGADYGAHICEALALYPDPNPYCSRAEAFTTFPPTNLMVGYAWSRGTAANPGGIGWISFNPDELVGCPCATAPVCDCEARRVGDEIMGWARACSVFTAGCSGVLNPERGGWDGWISLNCESAGFGCPVDYGVEIDPVDLEFFGWAWAGDDITENSPVGWISFSAENPEIPNPMPPGPPYAPEPPPYVVVPPGGTPPVPNTPPTATDLQSEEGDYCLSPAQQLFSWTFDDVDGDGMEFYQIQVNIDGFWTDPWSPSMDGEFDYMSDLLFSHPTGYFSKTVSLPLHVTSLLECPITGPPFTGCEELAYDTTYHWRLKVWDERGGESAWMDGPDFSTPQHAYPRPDFDWYPPSPVQDEIIQLCAVSDAVNCLVDNSRCYDNSNNLIPAPSCGGYSFTWFPPAGLPPAGLNFEPPSGANTENPEVSADSNGVYDTTLRINDGVGECVSEIKGIRVTIPLPNWKEIAP